MQTFGLVGWSGSGKTTLLKQLIPELIQRGYSVSTVKHTHHHFDIDKKGKDSYQHREAGATEVVITGTQRWALLHENRGEAEPRIEDLLSRMSAVDLVLIEGFKSHPHDKMEIHRPDVDKPLLADDDPTVVAVATDAKDLTIDAECLDLNNVPLIADFILGWTGLNKKVKNATA